jgi:hypothetical protein
MNHDLQLPLVYVPASPAHATSRKVVSRHLGGVIGKKKLNILTYPYSATRS